MAQAAADVTPYRNYHLPSFKKLFPQHVHMTKTHPYRHFIDHCLSTERTSFRNRFLTLLNSKPLTEDQLSVLGLGLKFVPKPSVSSKDFQPAFDKIEETFNKHKHFEIHPQPPKPKDHPFHLKSTWVPPNYNHVGPKPPTLDDFRRFQLSSDPPSDPPHNLSPELQTALRDLIQDRDITIKKSDKGGGITVMDTEAYIAQIHNEHLSDRNTYEPLDFDPTPAYVHESNDLIDRLYSQGLIDFERREFLRPVKPARLPIFYGLPKTHKPGIPLRPIVSGFDSPTDQFSKFMTEHLKPLAASLPSHIKDSFDMKRFLDTIPPLPDDTFLVTADIKSLYTNIPIDEGIETVCHYIDTHRHLLQFKPPPTMTFRHILNHILHRNSFRFLNQIYHQVSGTAMGCRMAPPYANIFLAPLDQRILDLSDYISHLKRFIDDLFFIFRGSLEELLALEKLINNLHPHIKFTFVHSRHGIPYLDLFIYLDKDRRLRTSVYQKPSDCCAYLHWSSHHSAHVKIGLIKGQVIRFNRLFDVDEDLHKHLHKFTISLLVQGFSLDIINKGIKAGLSASQHDALYGPPRPKPPASEFYNSITVPFSHMGRGFLAFIKAINHQNEILKEEGLTPTAPTLRPIFNRTANLCDLVTHTDTLRS